MSKKEKNQTTGLVIDILLRVGVLALVIFLCFRILKPFLGMLLWGLIIAIILFPLFKRSNRWLGGRSKLTSVLLIAVLLSVLVFPSIWLVNQLVDGVRLLADTFQGGDVHIPPPSSNVADWPLIGPWLYGTWLDLSQNLGSSLQKFLPQFASWAERIFGALASTGLGILQFAGSIVVAGVFLMFIEQGSESGKALFRKIVGERGEEFMKISEVTIRNVATGILGVAIIQTTLMGVGLILANIPLAAVWIIVILIMTIAQLPVLIFNIFLVIYLFAFRDPFPAVLWSLLFIVIGLIDNFLKPLIMGKGSDVPMLVIFLGAIGGFAAFGFIGLFLGAIILSLAYKLYVTWVSLDSQ